MERSKRSHGLFVFSEWFFQQTRSQAPSELRRKFLSREIMVLACSNWDCFFLNMFVFFPRKWRIDFFSLFKRHNWTQKENSLFQPALFRGYVSSFFGGKPTFTFVVDMLLTRLSSFFLQRFMKQGAGEKQQTSELDGVFHERKLPNKKREPSD